MSHPATAWALMCASLAGAQTVPEPQRPGPGLVHRALDEGCAADAIELVNRALVDGAGVGRIIDLLHVGGMDRPDAVRLAGTLHAAHRRAVQAERNASMKPRKAAAGQPETRESQQ